MNPDEIDRGSVAGTAGGGCLTVPFGAAIDDAAVEAGVRRAFREQRAFAFAPRAAWLGADASEQQRLAAAARAEAVASAAPDSPATRERLQRDARLMQRLGNAVRLSHDLLLVNDRGGAAATPADRRVVLIRELPGVASFFEQGPAMVLARVGQGPVGARVPTIYLGLRLFDLAAAEQDAAGASREALGLILRLEERAIETGFSHVEALDGRQRATLETLYRALREPARGFLPPDQVLTPPRRPVRVTAVRRQAFLRQLNARRADSPLDFDPAICAAAMRSLERLAQRAKRHGDAGSRREVVRLLVAAAGHDLHEVRNHANLLLERMLAPKEFDAPLARTFANVSRGATHRFSFDLPPRRGRYLLRIYRGEQHHRYPGESDVRHHELELRRSAAGTLVQGEYRFEELGHYDYCVVRVHASGRREWQKEAACNGRINVIPDLRGELALQIFPDIHGHTRTWWGDGEHPGLVYNEHGEVIRLGTFADIAAHLPHIQRRHGFSIVYLLGVQKRGSNREDWSPHATSASPFAPESLVEMEPRLGGNDGLRELVEAAHALGMKVVVDIVPHLNRRVHDVPESFTVHCFDDAGNLVPRASTDGRYGSWTDGVLLNYRRLAVWEWLAGAVRTLVERFDVDGVRCDIAHALPVVMKRNNAPVLPTGPRSDEEQVEGTIVVNEREDDHYVTTGFFDSACRDSIASPLHYLLMRELQQAARGAGKEFCVFLAEAYWGREQFLSRVGVVPYNSALFKICERVAQGTSPVSEIYHLYEDHYRHALPPGTELIGMFGNHDERRPVNTFGRDNLRPVLTLTSFLTNLLMDYEGNADGEAWKVFADNVYVDWNRFDSAADRSVERVFSEVYAFHRGNPGRGTLVPTDHEQVAAAIKPAPRGLWLAVCSFSADSATVSIDLHAAEVIDDDARYVVVDPTYSPVTRGYAHYTGRELRVTPLTTSVSYRQRVKLLRIDRAGHGTGTGAGRPDSPGSELLRDSFDRLLTARSREQVTASFAYRALAETAASRDRLLRFLDQSLLPLYDASADESVAVGLKRALYHAHREAGHRGARGGEGIGHLHGTLPPAPARGDRLLARALDLLQSRPFVFVSAEAEPFSKSGGLANVTFELPRELARLGESMYVITPLYRNGDARAVAKMQDAVARFGVTYTGVNVEFQLGAERYQVGVHRGTVEGVTYFLLDHHDLFDGLYWGYRSNERIRRRLALGRAAAEVMVRFGLRPQVVATNDAAASLVSGIVRADPYYAAGAAFADTSFVHVIHNGGWQYFDCYDRYEDGADLFALFNLAAEFAPRFTDPRDDALFNLMAAGIRFADQVFTVSPTYARQIERNCDGLESLLHDVVGINNGIGKDFRRGVTQRLARSRLEQRHGPRLRERIDADGELRGKLERRFPELLADDGSPVSFRSSARRDEVLRMRTKLTAQIEYGLTVDPDQVLYVMIHRVSDQKGFQILLDASQGMFRDLGVQAILGGPIAPNDHRAEQLAAGMRALMDYYPGSVATRIGYQEISLPLLAADAFLMPSEFEPGGISQLEAMSCGCIVVAHATGGLRDTVTPLQLSGSVVRGCGVLFGDYQPASFLDAVARCTWFFRHASASQIRRARNNARRSIVWWDRAAQRYQRELHALKETVPSTALRR